jgi:hypothetical protein
VVLEIIAWISIEDIPPPKGWYILLRCANKSYEIGMYLREEDGKPEYESWYNSMWGDLWFISEVTHWSELNSPE